MNKNRMEAFSDGVLAVAITIMVLEIKVPQGASVEVLRPLLPKLLSYILSFIYIGIYWSNHHHMLHTVTKVRGPILWANLHLMFWLTLVSFSTGWMGENHFAGLPIFLYGLNLLMCAVAYTILQGAIIKSQGTDSLLKKAVARDWKGKLSLLSYLVGMLAAFWWPVFSLSVYVIVALAWLVPDRRIEAVVG